MGNPQPWSELWRTLILPTPRYSTVLAVVLVYLCESHKWWDLRGGSLLAADLLGQYCMGDDRLWPVVALVEQVEGQSVIPLFGCCCCCFSLLSFDDKAGYGASTLGLPNAVVHCVLDTLPISCFR